MPAFASREKTMQFQVIPAAPSLQPYIRNYWMLTFRVLEPRGCQRIMTNGATCMMFFIKSGRLMLYGPSMHNLSIDFEPGEHVIWGLEFNPVGVHAFFPQSTAEFLDRQIAGAELGEPYARLESELSGKNAGDWARIADAFFQEQLARVGRSEDTNMKRMMSVFSYIEAHHPSTIRIADLAAEAHVCPRQFNRIFSEYVGLTPKEYLRIYRFHAALLALREHPAHTTLMQLAWDNGYYDLKHMTSDFKDICTHTPKSDELNNRITEAFAPTFSLLMKKKILSENIE